MGEVGHVGSLPSFDRPPVVEVAVGVHFMPLPALSMVELVRLADSLWRNSYPQTIEQPILPPLTPLTHMAPAFAFQMQAGSPLVRLWSLTEDQGLLIQVQHDRLLLNWRKLADDDCYPRYRILREKFAELWGPFNDYVASKDLGVLQVAAAEVSFFNRIPLVGGVRDIPDFIRALNRDWIPEGQVAMAYQIERDFSDPRLRAEQSTALNFRPDAGPMQLEITTRVGVESDRSELTDVVAALDVAHDLGVSTFDELTTENAHSMWGRRDADNR